MEKKIVLQPRFSNGNEVYVKVSILLEGKIAFTALCNPDGKISVQKLPCCKDINIYGNWRQEAATGADEIGRKWPALSEETRKRAIMCINELPRSFQRLCMVSSFTQADMVEVHTFIRQSKAMFAALQEGMAGSHQPPAESIVEYTSNWRRADIASMPTSAAQSLLDAFASEPERIVVWEGNAYRASQGAIEARPANDEEIANARAEAYSRQRKTAYMAMFKPGQAFGGFEEGNLYPCENNAGSAYVLLNLEGDDWRKVRASRLDFHDVYAEAPEAPVEATPAPLF